MHYTIFHKRYKELQAEGKDADNHDYKEEWIPFWENRVAQIFEEEVRLHSFLTQKHKYFFVKIEILKLICVLFIILFNAMLSNLYMYRVFPF
jgi:hypothetical protein